MIPPASPAIPFVRIDLGKLDLKDLDLDLGHALRGRVTLAHADGLSGTLEVDTGRLASKDVEAESVAIAFLDVALGKVALAVQSNTELFGVEATLQRGSGILALGVRCQRLTTPSLTVSSGKVDVALGATLHGVELVVEGSSGHLSATRAEFESLRVGSGAMQVVAAPLATGPLVLRWGEDFSLSAEAVFAALLDVSVEGFVVRAHEVALERLQLHGPDVEARELSAARGELRFVPRDGHADGGADSGRTEPSLPVIDWDLLDRISGRVNVDLGVVLKLPIFERDAVHEFRVEVDEGTVDFRKLESSLAGLEDSLLDFSVREDELVLELGVPFLPTRGFGRRLVAWELSQAERSLARQNRVRIARLAQPRVLLGNDSEAGDGAPRARGASDEAEPGRGLLREIAFQRLDVELSARASEADMNAALRRFGVERLRVQGDLVHSVERTVPSVLNASAERVHVELQDLSLGARLLDVAGMAVTRIPRAELQLSGARVERGELRFEGAESRRIAVGRFARDE